MDCPTRRGQGGRQCFCRRGCRRTGGNRPILCPTGTPAARPRLRPRPDKGGCCPPNSGQVPAASRPAFPLRHRRRLGWYRRCKSRAGRPCLWRPVFRRWAVHRRGGSPSSPPARLRRRVYAGRRFAGSRPIARACGGLPLRQCPSVAACPNSCRFRPSAARRCAACG